MRRGILFSPLSNYCSMEDKLDDSALIRTLSFSYPLLFAGTNGGHLLVFRISEDVLSNHHRRDSTPASSRTLQDYRMIAATHCGPHPIVGITVTPLGSEIGRSPFEFSIGTPNASVQVLVTCGVQHTDKEALSSSHVRLFELITSPTPSPIVSPFTAPSPRKRSLSVSSVGSLSIRRSSSFSRPKLTLYSVSPEPLTLLPLKDSQ